MMKAERGFTLIELLVVIAVLGVLATIVLVVINPGEQLARTRDAGRLAALNQLVKAAQNYQTLNGTGPANGTNWITQLVNAGELKAAPPNISYSSGNSCGDTSVGRSAWTMQNNYCYVIYPDQSMHIYASLESQQALNKCKNLPTCLSCTFPYYLWATDKSAIVFSCSTPGDACSTSCVYP